MFRYNEYNKSKRNIRTHVVLGLIASLILLGPLSVPLCSNMIVVMDSDDAIETAVTVLEENIPNAVITEYGSVEYVLGIQRVVGHVIWVSHGSEEGIQVQNRVSSWKEFSSNLDVTLGKDIILACDSDSIYEYASPDDVFGFDGPVEASIGALLISAAITKSSLNILAQSIIQDIQIGNFVPHLLELTMEEFVWATFNFALQTIFIGTGFLITGAMELAVYNICIALFIDTFVIAGAVMGGYASPTDLILPLIALLGGIILAIAITYPQYAALMAASTVLLSSPFGYFLIALNIGIYIANLVMEYND